MLFITQAFSMLWEAILENFALVVVMVGVLILAWVLWLAKGRGKMTAKRTALFVSAIAAVIGFFGLPYLFNSGLGSLTYWVDWAFHIAMVLGLFIYAYLVSLPAISSVQP